MGILAFETSAKAASVALLEGGNLLAESYQNAGLTHSRTILVMAEHLLQSCELTPQDVEAVAVAMGPGSFTGVRIGMAAAKGFAWGRELPLFGVSTLEAMAWGLGGAGGADLPCDGRPAQPSVQRPLPGLRRYPHPTSAGPGHLYDRSGSGFAKPGRAGDPGGRRSPFVQRLHGPPGWTAPAGPGAPAAAAGLRCGSRGLGGHAAG